MENNAKHFNNEKCNNGTVVEHHLPDESEHDLRLKVSGVEFRCNKLQMMKNCEFFRGMFQSNMKEAMSDCVQLKEADIETMSAVINFCMTGRIQLSPQNIHTVAELACKYQIPKLIEKCSLYLLESLNADNCISTMLFAHNIYLKEAYRKSRFYVLWNIMKLLEKDEFLEMEVSDLKKIISDSQLNVKCEIETLKAVMCWINHRRSERIHLLSEILLESSLLDFCTDQDLEMMGKNPDIIEDCNSDVKSGLVAAKNHKRKRRFTPHQIVSVGVHLESDSDEDDGRDSISNPRQIVFYDVDTCQTVHYADTPDGCLVSHDALIGKKGYSVCVQEENMFVSGGENMLGKNTWMMEIWCYNSFEKTWRVVGKLRAPRRHHAMCTLGESSLLLIGGFGRYRYRLDSVEKWNHQTEEWHELASLPERMVNITACQCDNHIFVIKNDSLSSLLSYNLESDQWTCHSILCTLGDVVFDARRVWMIPDNEVLFIGMDNLNTVLKFNTVTDKVEECSLFGNNDDDDGVHSSGYGVYKQIPKHFNVTSEAIQVLTKVYHIKDNLNRDKLWPFFCFFVKNELFALPSFP
ncbi:kelch-like protein 30 [Saccostrea echinata]|uniref:kelch-like protein 30 n=1 Tax=Saccostrea echinata TaxID=191078 RepID=UPI002A833362|nr:kelch-like protein 30 [Saccostrea echinata]